MHRRSAALVAILALGLVGVGGAASAAPLPAGTVGVFGSWAMAPSVDPSKTFEGTVTFPASAGFPSATVVTDSTTVKVPSGESAFLGSSTGFGQTFGSSRSQPYLYLSQASALTPSTTTITFSGPLFAGWGFALGDIDADQVHIEAYDAANAPIAPADLGAQAPENYCNNTPNPSSCGPGPHTDVPTWDEPSSSLVGSGFDSKGAYGWFQPAADVRTLVLTYSGILGIPTYQLWFAAPAAATTITGTLATPSGPPPAGTTLALHNGDGSEVFDIEEKPVIVPLAPDGSFSIVTEQGAYQLAVTVPEGFAAIAPIAVDATTAAVSIGTIILDPVLPDTGSTVSPMLWVAFAAILLGIVMAGGAAAARRPIRSA